MSKPITITIPHELGRAEARRRIDEGFGRFSQQFGGAMGALDKSWEGDKLRFSLQAMGQEVSGFVDVAETSVRLEVLLPNLLAMIAGKLKGRLQKEGQVLLEKK
ncbi:polyhydroxyalkanoic acid system family protein [Phenylobacterium sp.]|jgi:putative polyhydroxyalkanoate system protein|uniref:polyhydroxyalkanoic acid system family protein n=1 Tax=Phenylobacterium sp. TaxID=1871053 RepID=UPI002F940138